MLVERMAFGDVTHDNLAGYFILRWKSYPDIQDCLPALGRVGDCRRNHCSDLAS